MNDDRLDRLYQLLPAIYRQRDEEQGEPLRALLRVVTEQVNVIEDDIAQLYDNWFIETCEDWVVPYIGDLVGYRLAHAAGEPGDEKTAESRARNKILIPRRDVTNTIRNRRRKGTLELLELLAHDVAGWPARAVEFYTLLGWTQHLNYLHLERGRTADLRDKDALAQIDGPFDRIAHTVEVRRINSVRTPGRYNIASIGVFIWRLKPFTVTQTPAHCVEEFGPQCYTFSVLGHDTQCFVKTQPEIDPTHIAEEQNLSVPIRRWAFDRYKEDFYGQGKSLEVWTQVWSNHSSARPLPPAAIVPTDLSDWIYRPLPNHVAVDPVLGRLVFRPNELPKKGVRVVYVYAFSADIGGGEYDRPLSQPAECILVRVSKGKNVSNGETFSRIGEAWKHIQQEWAKTPDKPQNGVIEIVDSNIYTEQLILELKDHQSLQIRAANRTRPVLCLIDWQTDMPDALSVILAHGKHPTHGSRLSRGSRITFDGLLITGRSVLIRTNEMHRPHEICPAEIHIRHCTLVPGWSLGCDSEPKRGSEPSLELSNVHARMRIERSIIGSIQVSEDQVHTDPIPITITDSIVDATRDEGEALGAPGRPVAHAVLTISRCTVFGAVLVHAIELAENCIFTNCLSVARRQLGCMRFCYVPPGCRTPRRYHCQPDLAEQTIATRLRAKADIEAARLRERDRVRPRFNSVRYGRPDYAQLAEVCAEEIKRGADDDSEMGVFHDLFNPQREANLRARLDEYTPSGMQASIIFES